MTRRNRLLDILILLLGFAIVFDASAQLARHDEGAIIWQPVTEAPQSFEIQAIDDRPVFVA
jgi:hypothetical protein